MGALKIVLTYIGSAPNGDKGSRAAAKGASGLLPGTVMGASGRASYGLSSATAKGLSSRRGRLGRTLPYLMALS
jgi:hypothetical protein